MAKEALKDRREVLHDQGRRPALDEAEPQHRPAAPREHWIHLRTTNIVESPFNALRPRTDASRRFKKTENAKATIRKLFRVAEKSWPALSAPRQIKEVYEGKTIQRRNCGARKNRADKESRLTLLTHLLTEPRVRHLSRSPDG